MKQFIIIILLTPLLCNAQIIESSIIAGYNFNSNPRGVSKTSKANSAKGGFCYSVGIGHYLSHKTTLGLQYSANNIKSGGVVISSPLHTYSLYVCRKFPFLKNEVGISFLGGYSTVTNSDLAGAFHDYKGEGVNIGAAVIYKHYFNKLFICASASLNHVFLSGNAKLTTISSIQLQYYPLMLGGGIRL